MLQSLLYKGLRTAKVGAPVVTLAELLTTTEAARVAGVSEQTVRQWMKSGKLPYTETKLGGLIDPVRLGRLLSQREAAVRERAVKRG